jgi:hypothetical protein
LEARIELERLVAEVPVLDIDVQPERTLVTLDVDRVPGGLFFRPFAPLIRRLAQRSVTVDYWRFKCPL